MQAKHRAPGEMRHQLAADDGGERGAEQQHDQEGARGARPLRRRVGDLDQDPAGAHHRADEVTLQAAREGQLQRGVGRGGGERAQRVEQHAAADVAAMPDAIDPPLLLEDAEHGRHRIGARGPDEFVGRGVDAAGDMAGEEREDRVVEVVEAGDQRDYPGKQLAAQRLDMPERRAGCHRVHGRGLPERLRARRSGCAAWVGLACFAAAWRLAISSSGLSPAMRRSM